MKDTTSPIAELSPHSTSGLLALFATTVFVSAFLLFQVQPMIGKYILPWFGSTPGVWTTALLFFQLMLLGGYIYAHFIVSRLTWRRQAILHATLLGLALVALPITLAEALKPTNAGASIGRILLILGLSVGAPYLMLSATGPLLQRWFAELHPSRSPYRLYALSNTGSLLALLSYPFMVERFVRLEAQTLFWSLGYIGFAALCGACAWKVFHLATAAVPQQGESEIEPSPTPVASSRSGHRPGLGPTLLWLSLSACGSALLLATTNQMSMDIAVIPFLWILPLGIYLLTFILCFDHERWYVRPLFVALLPLALMNALRLVYGGAGLGIVDQMVPQHDFYPDVVLLQRREDAYASVIPEAADALLVIEVADTTLQYDRGVKLPRYAAAGAREVWIIDLVGKCIWVHRRPLDGDYGEVFAAREGEVLNLKLGSVDFEVKVDDILP